MDKTEGICIRYMKYKETSLIVDIFTKDLGMMSFIVNGVRSKKPKFSIAQFQPLSILEIVLYKKNKPDTLQRFVEIRNLNQPQLIASDIKKSTITLFLSEVLFKSLKHESNPQPIFDFVKNSILFFELQQESLSEFHLKFLLRLTKFLGFSPETSKVLMDQLVHDNATLEPLIDGLLHAEYSKRIINDYNVRITILDLIIDFYKIHIEGFGDLRSYSVLHTILSE